MKLVKYGISVLIAYALLLTGAVFLDCKRIKGSLENRITEIDGERIKIEARYTENIMALPRENSEPFLYTLARYKESKSLEERAFNFTALSTQVSQQLSSLPFTESIRRVTDELNGLLNRRERMQPEYEKVVEELKGLRLGICKYCVGE